MEKREVVQNMQEKPVYFNEQKVGILEKGKIVFFDRKTRFQGSGFYRYDKALDLGNKEIAFSPKRVEPDIIDWVHFANRSDNLTASVGLSNLKRGEEKKSNIHIMYNEKKDPCGMYFLREVIRNSVHTIAISFNGIVYSYRNSEIVVSTRYVSGISDVPPYTLQPVNLNADNFYGKLQKVAHISYPTFGISSHPEIYVSDLEFKLETEKQAQNFRSWNSLKIDLYFGAFHYDLWFASTTIYPDGRIVYEDPEKVILRKKEESPFLSMYLDTWDVDEKGRIQ